MKTHFAPAERLDDSQLSREIDFVINNPVIDALTHVISGLLAVLNEHRQIIALNERLLQMLGIGNAQKVLGLRPGEAIGCMHAHEMPGGCGTSEYCASCGAAIAIVASLGEDRPIERTCALTVDKGGDKKDLYLRVRSCPITIDGKRFLLLFLQDISYEQRMAALERTFFHDINNIISGLLNASHLLSLEPAEGGADLPQIIYRFSQRLTQEVAAQRCLTQTDRCHFQPVLSSVTLAEVMQDIKNTFAKNPLAKNKLIRIPGVFPELSIKTDFSLLLRVLNNMIVNALEETPEGDEIRILLEHSSDSITFMVWNRTPIAQEVKKRVFQRNFTTKPQAGRGLGTYSMKLFGEDILGGKVTFTSSEAEGTTFRFTLSL